MTQLRIDPLARNRAARYGAPAVAYHWITAILVVIVGTIGLFFDEYPKAQFPSWLTVHALLGLTILGLLIARLSYRMKHTPPDLPGEPGEFTRRTSHAAHMLLYALLIVTPLFGIAGFITHGRYLALGPVHLGFPYGPNRALFRPMEKIHQWLAYTIFALAAIHALAALWHQFVLRDDLILRIWPSRKPRREF